ncbi:MAG TPA: hypothetical protein VHX63_16115 [Acidobacteriaceae bacterium]|jgi:hypothetical protein|nr:hypothetical protein [Acidobacteriaceae bacterium]
MARGELIYAHTLHVELLRQTAIAWEGVLKHIIGTAIHALPSLGKIMQLLFMSAIVTGLFVYAVLLDCMSMSF